MNKSFNKSAQTYDEVFSESQIGILLRERVHHLLEKFHVHKKGDLIYEMNCGTGVDAIYFFNQGCRIKATDASDAMIEQAKIKNNQIAFEVKDFQSVLLDPDVRRADVVFSNFGGLNCISPQELEEFCHILGSLVKKGSKMAFIIMPKFCLIESLYFFIKGKFIHIFRRNTAKALHVEVTGTIVPTFYHSPGSLKKMLAPNFKIQKIRPVGIFLPPSYLEPSFTSKQGKWVLQLLNRLENFFGRTAFFSSMSDHFIIYAVKK